MTTLPDTLERIPTAQLVPYARNSRTHSPAQISQVAASIKEFGFTNPVLIDADNGIIAGHGRVMAALSLGLAAVPCIRFDSMPKSYLKNGVKDCLCLDCGTEFSVRKDTSPTVCRRCTQVRAGKGNRGAVRAERKPCAECKKPIRVNTGDKYCSLECRSKNITEIRQCKVCLKEFKIYKSHLTGKTNSAGKFCSRPCYEKWLCNTERVTGRGSQWKNARDKAISRHPFCALCGTSKQLQVHHIAPFRLSHDNGQGNLIPLCTKHHKIVETLTHDIEATGSSPDDIKLIIGNMLAEYSAISAYILTRRANYAPA